MALSKDETRALSLEVRAGEFPSDSGVQLSLAISAKRMADALEGIEALLQDIYAKMPERHER
jgi:hypothetical protein